MGDTLLNDQNSGNEIRNVYWVSQTQWGSDKLP